MSTVKVKIVSSDWSMSLVIITVFELGNSISLTSHMYDKLKSYVSWSYEKVTGCTWKKILHGWAPIVLPFKSISAQMSLHSCEYDSCVKENSVNKSVKQWYLKL